MASPPSKAKGVVHVDALIACKYLKDHNSCNWCHKDGQETPMHGQHLIAKKITSFVEAGEDWEQVAKQVLRKMVREICTLSKDMDAPESIRKVVQKSVIRYMPLDVVNGPDFSKEI